MLTRRNALWAGAWATLITSAHARLNLQADLQRALQPAQKTRYRLGYLPVTCHLTCPVTDFATKTSRSTRFESQRFTDFPTVVETVKSGRLDATFMIAPLAMKLREQGVNIRIAYLGHRDGSTVMVRTALTSGPFAP